MFFIYLLQRIIVIDKHIHIVSLNVPFPANYGGIIDIFHKLKALSELGVKIHLHCFEYGRGTEPELDKYCESINYYKRKTGLLSWLSKKPYIVNSRRCDTLIENLNNKKYPILFEGLHTTFYIEHKSLQERFKIVRTHNVEHEYYKYLAQQEKNILRRLFFKSESKRLLTYEEVLKNSQIIAAISPNDANYFKTNYKSAILLPPFHSSSKLTSELGHSDYAFYHGNLSVRENIQAVLFLIETFKESSIKIIIAGKNPTKLLKDSIKQHSHFSLISNPDEKEMAKLKTNAQIHLLPTFQPTGIKLKLIASLFEGRHCIVNPPMVIGTGLESLCHIANSAEEFKQKTLILMDKPFENKDLIMRKEILVKHFTNKRNAEYLISQIRF